VAALDEEGVTRLERVADGHRERELPQASVDVAASSIGAAVTGRRRKKFTFCLQGSVELLGRALGVTFRVDAAAIPRWPGPWAPPSTCVPYTRNVPRPGLSEPPLPTTRSIHEPPLGAPFTTPAREFRLVGGGQRFVREHAGISRPPRAAFKLKGHGSIDESGAVRAASVPWQLV
jgi:hypothetical protein